MAIVIFGDNFSFPEGDASTNRVYTYARGISENGIVVHVVCFSNEYNNAGDGQTDGIYFYNPFGQRSRSNSFLLRRWQKFIKYFRTLLLIRRINKRDKISTILVYTMRLSTHLLAWYLSKANHTKLIKECSEHPLIHYQSGVLKKTEGRIKLKIESCLCDGILCISLFLVDFYKETGLNQAKLFLVPSTVDPTRFEVKGEKPLSYSYIGYFGGLTFSRDNIDVLIKAYAMICEKHPAIYLVLGGFCSDKEKKQIENLILELRLTGKVNLLKYLPRTEIVRYITHSDILVMVRAKDLETAASFPSKLTEYLCTATPVVTVDVGEIPDYLTDGVNTFLVEPGNVNALAEKLDYILNNYESAKNVAKQGKQLTETVFNYNYQGKRIIKYIETL
jgi:glycosyltransferase involved in cell wall biosynthesis